jgi:hypothetical protein
MLLIQYSLVVGMQKCFSRKIEEKQIQRWEEGKADVNFGLSGRTRPEDLT